MVPSSDEQPSNAPGGILRRRKTLHTSHSVRLRPVARYQQRRSGGGLVSTPRTHQQAETLTNIEWWGYGRSRIERGRPVDRRAWSSMMHTTIIGRKNDVEPVDCSAWDFHRIRALPPTSCLLLSCVPLTPYTLHPTLCTLHSARCTL